MGLCSKSVGHFPIGSIRNQQRGRMTRRRLIFLFLILAASAKPYTEAGNLHNRSRSPIFRRVAMHHCTKALHFISSKNIEINGQRMYKTPSISTFVIVDIVPKPLKHEYLQNIGNSDELHAGQRAAGVSSYNQCYRVQMPVCAVLLKNLPSYIRKTIRVIADNNTDSNEVINDQSNVKNNTGRVDKSNPLEREKISAASQDKKQPDHRSSSAVTEMSRQKHELVRTKRCVGKECVNDCNEEICKDAAEVATRKEAANKKKQPDHRSSSAVTEMSRQKHELVRTKRCVGKECVNDCNEEICKDAAKVVIRKEAKPKKSVGNKDSNAPMIFFESRELVGLVLILVMASLLIYLNAFHGTNEYVRRYMTFGILILFLLFITVAVQMFSRAPISTRD